MAYIQNFLLPLAQKDYLQREFYEALAPQLAYLALAPYEEFQGGVGQTMTKTAPGVMDTEPKILEPGKDLTASTIAYEYYRAKVDQYGDSRDIPLNQTHMVMVGARGYFMQVMRELAQQAGTQTNKLARDALFAAYTAGNAIAYAANGNTTTLYLNTLNGFWEVVRNGEPYTISVSAPRAITVGGVARLATGFNPLDPDHPNGPGTLTISVAIDCPAGTRILADDRSRILRPNSTPFDSLQPNDGAKLALFQRAAAELWNDGVPPMADGCYHVHCAPFVIQELTSDNDYKRLFEGNPDGYAPDGSIGKISNLRFFPNNQSPAPGLRNSPNPLTVPTRGTQLARGYHSELYNILGTQIQRSIVLGKGAISTLYIDERKTMLGEAGAPLGPETSFAMVGEQLQMMMGASAIGNVRVIIRPPLDRAGQQVAVSWTTSRGFAVRSNLLSGQSNARNKRALVVETGFVPLE